MAKENRQLLVTTALLYANGPLHLGHLLEQIQADIWVRFQRLHGHSCYFIGGEDAHGTPIMLAADKQKIPVLELVNTIAQAHQHDLEKFNIQFDYFGTTHTVENQNLVNTVYQNFQNSGDIQIQTVEQAYDTQYAMFLPDRYVKGTCPHCDSQEQYGDNCEQCGATYNALELKDAVSVLSNTSPVSKSSEQHFLLLNHYQDFIKNWVITSKTVLPQIKRKLLEWLESKEGLKPLCLSRDAPYFGFHIPNTLNKYFYVWLDAPIGYIAIFKALCKEKNIDLHMFWHSNSATELHHFIGKDIIKFHAIFWPIILKGFNFRLPTQLVVHGHLTIATRKMSKSRGTFITAQKYLKYLDPEYLRYYFASKLNGTVEDIDLNWTDFSQKINTELVGKLINIASRCAKLLENYCQNQLSEQIIAPQLLQSFQEKNVEIAQYFERLQYNHAVHCIMRLADQANQYLEKEKPWKLAKIVSQHNQLQQVCTMGINLFRLLIIYLKPILPTLALKTEHFFNVDAMMWQDYQFPLIHHTINSYQPLLSRVAEDVIQALIKDSK